MADVRIADASIDALRCPIAALKDEPDMNAQELKEYFDGSPTQLMEQLNKLVAALRGRRAAADLGFTSTELVPAATVQSAIEWIAKQGGGSGGTADNIGRAQLSTALRDELDGYAAVSQKVARLTVQLEQLSERVSALEA